MLINTLKLGKIWVNNHIADLAPHPTQPFPSALNFGQMEWGGEEGDVLENHLSLIFTEKPTQGDDQL